MAFKSFLKNWGPFRLVRAIRWPWQSKSARSTEHFADVADRLAESRGDNITALPADRSKSSIENVAAAAKDYGISIFSGESDSMGKAAGGYRASRKRRDRKRS